MGTWFRFGYHFLRFSVPRETSFPDWDTWKCCYQLLDAEFEVEGVLWSSSGKVTFGLRSEGTVATSTAISRKGFPEETAGAKAMRWEPEWSF